MPPRAFGKYEVLARLATGGAANIFLARQPGAAGFHKLVCLKTLLPERASDEDFVAMFLDEARLAARLNHPNCVQIYDLGRVHGVYFISMEYIFGDTLWNLLTTVTKLRTPLPSAHVAAIIANACDGLHHAHELKDGDGRMYNLVHRDVSPQNIMITYEGQTKVVDFGIAKAETGRAPTIAGIVKGKFSYMSPEQITGGSVDRRSDIYSLGIVFFECLASRRLYRGESPEDIARLILEHRAPRLRDVVPDVPPELDEICAKALARHPSKRFQTAVEMGDALRDYLDSIRYNQSASSLAKLLEERFGDAVKRRRVVFEAALAGTYDEQELLKSLEARAVRNVDLFPDGEPNKGTKDFNVETKEHVDHEIEPPDLPTKPLERGRSSIPGSEHAGAGFRVEIQGKSRRDSPPISLLKEEEDFGRDTSSDATRIDPHDLGSDDLESEDLTCVDPEAVEDNLAAVPALDEGEITVRPGEESDPFERSGVIGGGSLDEVDATAVDLLAEGAGPPGWDGDATKTDGPFDEKTPFEGERSRGKAGAARDHGVVVTAAARGSKNGAVVTRSKSVAAVAAPSAIRAVPVVDHTVEEVDVPTREDSRARSDLQEAGVATVETESDDPAPEAEPDLFDAESEPDSEPEPVVERPPSPQELSQTLRQSPVQAPASLDRRYTFAALMAAMAFGISFGLIAGILLARFVFPD